MQARSRFVDELTGVNTPFAPTLFYSLLNTVLTYDPVGYGVPYAGALLRDKEEGLVNTAVQALLVLLDYAPLATQQPENASTAANSNAAANPNAQTPASPEQQQKQQHQQQQQQQLVSEEEAQPVFAQFNIYRSMLAGLGDAADFDLIYGSISRLLNTVPASQSAMLPGAYGQVSCGQELLVLLWKLCDENPAFLQHVLTKCDVTQIVGPMLHIMWSGRNNVTKVGLLHLCTFILLLLSGERAFGVGMNRPYIARLPMDGLPLFDGSHADLLIIVLHRLTIDGSPKLSTLYSCFLTIICNVSPYAKGFSLVASIKLVNLFELFSSPRFLFARSSNYTFAQQLLETFNNLVQYQYESNGVLVYRCVHRA